MELTQLKNKLDIMTEIKPKSNSFNKDYFKLKTLIREMVEDYKDNIKTMHEEQQRVYLKLVLAMEEL